MSTFVYVSSPSLECDSEEEDMLGNTYPCSSLKRSSIFQSSSGEERDSFDTSPELNRTFSDSTHQSAQVSPIYTPFPHNSERVINSIINIVRYNVILLFQLCLLIRPIAESPHSALTCLLIQEPEEVEVRLRSYSYTSPKAKPSRPLLNRDVTIGDLAEGE